MMTVNKPTSTGAPSGDAPACGFSVQDPSVLDLSVRDRLNWINERVEIAQGIIDEDDDYTDPLLLWVLGTVEEFAELLRVHFAGVES
jgi:hypothetical protein